MNTLIYVAIPFIAVVVSFLLSLLVSNVFYSIESYLWHFAVLAVITIIIIFLRKKSFLVKVSKSVYWVFVLFIFVSSLAFLSGIENHNQNDIYKGNISKILWSRLVKSEYNSRAIPVGGLPCEDINLSTPECD